MKEASDKRTQNYPVYTEVQDNSTETLVTRHWREEIKKTVHEYRFFVG